MKFTAQIPEDHERDSTADIREMIFDALAAEDNKALKRALGELNGPAAVRYLLQAMIEPGHGMTIPGVLALLK